MSLILAALAAAAQPIATCDTITFSREPALRPNPEAVTLCRAFTPAGAPIQYQIHRSSPNADRSDFVTTYASTATCPAARARLEELERLPLPSPDVPGMGAEVQSMTLDGAAYRLQVRALYGPDSAHLTVGSNVGTPLARWIDGMLTALEPCWRDRP